MRKGRRLTHKKVHILIILQMLLMCVPNVCAQTDDSQNLGMAIDYFQGGKYHEALMLLSKLDKKYKLNPRFKAYLGVCYFYDWEYEHACKYLDDIIPTVRVYAPEEQSVYYYSNAESHFNLKQYKKAIPLYEQLLNVCHDNEKAHALYRIGICYMFTDDVQNSYEYLESSLSYYFRYGNIPENKARIEQITNMIKGLRAEIK